LGVRHRVVFYPRDANDDAPRIISELAVFRPDVVHCHSFYGNLEYGFLATVSNLYPTCFTVHDPRPIGGMDTVCWTCERNGWCLRCPLVNTGIKKVFGNPYLRRRWQKKRVHAACRQDLVVVSPSQWMLGRLRGQELGRFRCVNIPNGVDLDHFSPMGANRDKFGLPKGKPILLHLAWHAGKRGINERKGLPDLAEAFLEYIIPSFPDAILAVAGEAFVPNHPSVVPLGMIEQVDIPALFSAVDVYVAPTLADNFPYTVLEAMACGKPVVASRFGGIPEQVIEGETGWLFPPGNPQAMAEAICRVIGDPAQAAEMGAAGRKRVEKMFGLDTFVSAYETLFREMTGGVEISQDGCSAEEVEVGSLSS
ncbi:MAG: glycosyltransferase, partial [Chthoniobacter sp.]